MDKLQSQIALFAYKRGFKDAVDVLTDRMINLNNEALLDYFSKLTITLPSDADDKTP